VCIWRLNVLVRAIVYIKLLLTRGVDKEGLYCRVDVGEEPGRREAFDEYAVAPCDDGVADDIRVGFDKALEAAID
jgi:hypothetical protein